MIITLFGAMGSGKDTTGDLLVANHGFTKASFASPLKRMAKIAFPALTDEDLYGSSKHRERRLEQYPFSGPCLRCNSNHFSLVTNDTLRCNDCASAYPTHLTPRIILQTLGEEWGRRLHKPLWANAAIDTIPPSVDTIITDGRYRTELRATKARNGISVLLYRGLRESTTSHPSEAELRTIPASEFDYQFRNDILELSDLPQAVEDLVRWAKNRPKG